MPNTKRQNSNLSAGCLVLFALPFAAVGVGMIVWMSLSAITYFQAQRWVKTPARIIRSELKASRGSKGGTTYEVRAEYVYTFDRHEYTGHRVGISSGSDNIGTFQQTAYQELHSHQVSRTPFPCYVNPVDPSQALLYRDLRWEMLAFQSIFAVAFGGVGFGLMIGGFVQQGKQRRARTLAAAHPTLPWKWKPEWAAGQTVYSSKPTMIAALCAAAFTNLIVAPLWFLLPNEIFVKGNRWALIGLILPMVGLGLAAWALVAVLRWMRFGKSVFQMADVPGVIGGKLAGVVRTSAKIRPQDGFTLTLRCVRRITTGTGKSRSTTERVIWEDERIAMHELLEDQEEQSAIPVLFQIPYSCVSSDERDPDDQTLWRLSVAAHVPGVDYAASFCVPVFKTGQSDPNFTPDEGATADLLTRPSPERELREARVLQTMSPDGDGQRFVFPMLRTPGITLGLGIVALGFGGAVALTLHVPAPIVFPIAFGFVDFLLLLGLLDVLFYRSVVDVSTRGLTVRGGLLGIGTTRQVDIADIASWETRQGFSSNQNAYFNLVIVCRNKKSVTLAKRLLGTRLASAVLRQIEVAAGVGVPPSGGISG